MPCVPMCCPCSFLVVNWGQILMNRTGQYWFWFKKNKKRKSSSIKDCLIGVWCCRSLGVDEEELAMGTWTVSAACGPQVVSTGVSELLTLLVAIQSAALASLGADNANFDPKYYVDLSLKYTLNETQIAFYALPRSGSNVIAPGMYGFKVSAISCVLWDHLGESRGYGFVR